MREPNRTPDAANVPEQKDAPCNICGRGWPYHHDSCAYKQTATERDQLRRLLYELVREVPASQASVYRHRDLQDLHRRVIAALGEEDPGEFVTSDYWLGRTP